MTIEVAWRAGGRTVVSDVLANHIYEIDEAAAQPALTQQPRPEPRPLFEEVTAQLAPDHHEDSFNDFERQQLLPKMLSRLGPGIAWFDLDGDGHDDLILGTGKGGRPSFLRNDGKGQFSRIAGQFELAADDLAGAAGWIPSPGKRSVLFGLANYESPEGQGSSVLEFANGKSAPLLQNLPSSSGPLAIADVNGDGALDLFVGGRVLPGRYPEAASSGIYLNRNGRLLPDEANNRLLARVGLVSGAVWSDLDGDGSPDLAIGVRFASL